MIAVEGTNGFDVGTVSLTGELVKLQMKKYGVKDDEAAMRKVLRMATEEDLSIYHQTKEREQEVMIKSRAIARQLNLEMKICEVEIQADGKKATFFYTADGRVDFRELIKIYASEFKMKIEMRQIGARQESGKVGGIGACGRELCCSTWLTDFKSVNTSAARYQNLSINQTKLSGQCGRLKCCLNYELDTYLDALRDFPEDVEVLKTHKGKATLIKTDIFKRLIFYAYETDRGDSSIVAVAVDVSKESDLLNEHGEIREELHLPGAEGEGDGVREVDSEHVTGAIELPEEKRRRKKRRKPKNRQGAEQSPP